MYAPSTARTQYAYDAPWDATMLFGCVCEAPYAGFDCSYRTCATGDIPTTTGQVNEVQLIQCTGASSGERESTPSYITAVHPSVVDISNSVRIALKMLSKL